jgi:nucleotide-binding universal stress UspA family protein
MGASRNLRVHTELLEGDPSAAIVRYAERHHLVKMITMSTHGEGGLGRLVFGSVADKVLHDSPVPVLLVKDKESRTGNEAQPAASVRYETILVPLDGSSFAETALEPARQIALATQAVLVLLSAVPDDPIFADMVSSFGSLPLWDHEFEWRRDYLEATASRLSGEGLKVERHVVYRPPLDAILEMGERQRVDLIVMSTHGRGGFQRLWLGSVADEVVRRASQPVLLVRARARAERPDALKRNPRQEGEAMIAASLKGSPR